MASFQLAQLHSEREPTIIKASVHLLMVIVEGPSIIAMYKFYKCPYCNNLYFEKYQFEDTIVMLCSIKG